MPVLLTNAEKRLARIQVLAEELRTKSIALHDGKTRTRCRIIALEIAGLIQAEESHRRTSTGITKSRPHRSHRMSTSTR